MPPARQWQRLSVDQALCPWNPVLDPPPSHTRRDSRTCPKLWRAARRTVLPLSPAHTTAINTLEVCALVPILPTSKPRGNRWLIGQVLASPSRELEPAVVPSSPCLGEKGNPGPRCRKAKEESAHIVSPPGGKRPHPRGNQGPSGQGTFTRPPPPPQFQHGSPGKALIGPRAGPCLWGWHAAGRLPASCLAP